MKLLDATTGKVCHSKGRLGCVFTPPFQLRASYSIIDHRERQIAPQSLAFTFTGEKLYCGFEEAIEVFDVACPGEGTRIYTTPSKKSKDGLKGAFSVLTIPREQTS